MKNKLLITMSCLLVVGLLTGCGCKKKEKEKKEEESNIKVNIEKEVIKDREIEGIKITNTSLIVEDGISYFTSRVTNPTEEDYHLDEYRITFKDKDGNVVAEIPGSVGDVIKAGETRTIDSSIDIDLSNAVSAEYTIKK